MDVSVPGVEFALFFNVGDSAVNKTSKRRGFPPVGKKIGGDPGGPILATVQNAVNFAPDLLLGQSRKNALLKKRFEGR